MAGALYPQWRNIIRIDVTNPPSATGFQVAVIIPYLPGMSYDFSDLRFSDGIRALPYCIETPTSVNGTSAKVWVKLTEYGQAAKEFYCYYGNPAAVSESSGDNTFEIWDDFIGSAGSSPDTSKWDLPGNGLRNTVVDLDGNSSLRVYLNYSTHSGGGVIAKNAFSLGSMTIESRMKTSSYMYTGAMGLEVGFSDRRAQDTTYYYYYADDARGGMYYNSTIGRLNVASVGGQTLGSGSLEDPRNKWGLVTIKFNPSTYTVDGRYVYGSTDTTLQRVQASNDVASLYPFLHWGEYNTLGGYYAYFDWVRVRQYAATEPTCTPARYGINPAYYNWMATLARTTSSVSYTLTATLDEDHVDLVWSWS